MKLSFVHDIIQRLKFQYGNPPWQLRPDAIAVLLQTILSQNTSDANSDRAFISLQTHFKNWDAVARASLPRIAAAIKQGGLAEVKAGYIKDALEEIKKRHGKLDLQFLKNMPLAQARDWLLQLPGVGLKTANCVLLFSLGMPALPVDTHVYRVSGRLGLIQDNLSVEVAHRKLGNIIPAREVFRFHILLIEHGRNICRARNPLCRECILASICKSSDKFDQPKLSLKGTRNKKRGKIVITSPVAGHHAT